MKEREPKVMTLRQDGSRDAEVILSAVVSICESAEYFLTRHSGDRVRRSGVLSSCMGSA